MRVFLVFLICSFLAFGIESPYVIEARLIDAIARAITRKSHPSLCPEGINISNIIPYLKYSTATVYCNKADMIISDSSIAAFGKPYFALDFESLLKNKDAVGGLYWLDGRYQLVFIKERLSKFHITLPNEYRQFEVSIKNLEF